MIDVSPFTGVWVLDPARCDYGDATPPARGIYTLMQAGHARLVFDVQWLEADGEPGQVRFDATFDGQEVPLPPEHGQGFLRSALEADGALVTEVVVEGRVVHRAERRLVGEELHIVQTLPTGRTSSVYVRGRVKQVICYRRDLKMRKGKIAAQSAHASLGAVVPRRAAKDPFEMSFAMPGPVAWWMRRGSAKVVLSVDDEAALLKVHELAVQAGLPCSLITDAGKTEFGGVPTRTAVAVGPWLAEDIDRITGPEGQVATKLA